jgi:hypothetical protein
MRRAIRLTLAVAINAIFASVSQAHTNSCVSSTDGFWDEARIWSLAKPPSIRQSAILITNAASETITIDNTTATHFKSTLTISNLSISALSGSDALYLDNTGSIALHILNDLIIGISLNNFGDQEHGGGELLNTNSTLIVDGLLGGQLEDDGTLVITGGSLITTNCSLLVGTSFDGLLIISNGVVQARDISIALGDNAIGTMEVIGGTMTLSSSLTVADGFSGTQGYLLVANGCVLVVTNAATTMGADFYCYGSITVTNATILASDMGVGEGGGGALSIEAGTVTLEGSLIFGDQSNGSVSLNGGMLVATNSPTLLGGEMGYGAITVEDGIFLAQEILVGSEYQSYGIVTVNGGAMHLSSNLQVGGVGLSSAGVFVNGGQLVVTNSSISVSGANGGSIAVSGGLLAANYINLDVRDIESGIYNPITGTFVVTGTLAINGGSVTASTGITLGDCASNTLGQIILDDGLMTVTNAAHTGFIDIQNGQLVLSSGLLQVDKLVMTNTCSSFVHTGGTLIVGGVILDPNAFQITSVAREGNDLLITWLMAPGQTNALQVSSGGIHGIYETNGFVDIFIVTNNTIAGSLTNYLDIGAATNKPSRYYRARLSP